MCHNGHEHALAGLERSVARRQTRGAARGSDVSNTQLQALFEGGLKTRGLSAVQPEADWGTAYVEAAIVMERAP